MSQKIQVHQVSKTYPNQQNRALNQVSCSVNAAQILAVVGPSGSGKTSLLRVIAGLETIDEGEVRLSDTLSSSSSVTVPAHQRKIGYVFQEPALLPHLNVLQNVLLATDQKASTKEQTESAKQALALMKADRFQERNPQTLSGGEQQRVALARAIVQQPNVLLLDEPFSHLDPHLRFELAAEVREIVQQQELATILVTHDGSEALSVADEICFLHQGEVNSIASPVEIYQHPETELIARSFGRVSLIPANCQGEMAETPLGKLPLECSSEGNRKIFLRPEEIEFVDSQSDAAFQFSCRVEQKEYLGSHFLYRVKVDELDLLVSSKDSFSIGEQNTIVIKLKAGKFKTL